MNCDKAQENLSAYLDGELDPGEAGALKEHLEGCSACSAELESLRSTVALVRSLPRAQAPAVLRQRVMSATGRRAPARRFPGAVALLTAAALVLVAVVAVFMLSPRETPPAEVTANGMRAKSALERDSEGSGESATTGLRKKGWTGSPQEATTPAARRATHQYEKEQIPHSADRKSAEKEKQTADFSKFAPAPPRSPAQEAYREEQAQKKAPAADAPERTESELAERKLADRMNEALKKDDPAAIEKPAQFKRKTRWGGGQARGAAKGEKLAEARRQLKEEKPPGTDTQEPPLEEEMADEGEGTASGPPVEEIVLEARNIDLTAEAVAKLAKACNAQAVSDGRTTSEDETGRGGAAGLDKAGAEDRVLLVQIDRARLREFLDSVEGLPQARRVRPERREAPEKEEKEYSGRNWGAKEEEAKRLRARDERKKESEPRDPEAPVAGEPAKPGKPAPKPQEPLTGDNEREAQQAKKKPLAGPKPGQKQAGKQLPGDALEQPLPTPPRPGENGTGALGKPAKELVTLRIRIVRSSLPAAKLHKQEADPAKAEPAESKGK